MDIQTLINIALAGGLYISIRGNSKSKSTINKEILDEAFKEAIVEKFDALDLTMDNQTMFNQCVQDSLEALKQVDSHLIGYLQSGNIESTVTKEVIKQIKGECNDKSDWNY